MTTDKIRPEGVDDELKTFSMTLRIADPTVDTHPFVLYAPFAGAITRVNAQTRSSTGTDTTTFSILIEGNDPADYTAMVSTASSGVQTTTGEADDTENQFAIGETIEVDITALPGAGYNYFDVEIQGVLL
jgi:hypothetical protein